jgi:hypothetical protein
MILLLLLNLSVLHAVGEQDVYRIATCFDISSGKLISEVENCNSYLHYATLFSDLSRNMTSSSSPDLFEDNSTGTGTQFQDNVDSNTEANGLQEGDASDTNQTSPSSDLFEDNNENTQLQENEENNNTDIDQQDETTTELQGNNDNNTVFG